MDKKEIIRRLKRMSEHAVYVPGRPPFIMSIDDGVALDEAVSMMEDQQKEIENLKQTAQSMMEGICLLKEHESVQGVVDADGAPRCGSCGWVQSYGCNYCDNCGKRLIWE